MDPREFVASAKLLNDPLPLLMWEGAMPQTWGRLVSELPGLEGYEPFRHPDSINAQGEATRYRLRLTRSVAEALGTTARLLYDRMTSTEMQQALFDRLDVTSDAVPRLFVMRDLPGYRIDWHCDSPNKVMTCQWYLANGPAHLGTWFRGDGSGKEIQLPFLRGNGYAFAVTGKSYHAVMPVTEGEQRLSLMLIYYRPEAPEIRDEM